MQENNENIVDENLQNDTLDAEQTAIKEALLSDDIDMHPVDLAEQLEQLPFEEQVDVVKNMSPLDAADALAELDEEHAGSMLESLTLDEAAAIISEMSPDDAVDVLDEIDEEQRDEILNVLGQDEAEQLRNLLSFDSETAAGIMNTEMLLLPFDSTPDEVIQTIRDSIDYIENVYYVYLVDKYDKLKAIISMRDLMRLPKAVNISEKLEIKDIIYATFDMDKKEAAQLLAKYSFFSIPVLDNEGHILGVITHDDVIDIIQDEASADMLGMVGAGQDEDVDTPWGDSVKIRFPWLLVNLVNSSISASVVYLFDGTISQMALLAVLMPVVANQSGNTGQQALAVMIRQLATESFSTKRAFKAVMREIKIGIASSILLSIIVFLCVNFAFGNTKLAIVTGFALALDMILAAFLGASIPLFFRRIGRDPAQASSIFLTSITDAMGFLILLGLASLMLFS